MSRIVVTIQGRREDVAEARAVIDWALTEAGFPPAKPDLRVVGADERRLAS